MSNAEPSSAIVPIGPRALLRVEALPVERHPAAVYLSSLGSGSRRTMRQSLAVIANLVSGGRADTRTLAWEKLRYQHCQAVRTALAEKYAAGTTNKMLAALPTLEGGVSGCWYSRSQTLRSPAQRGQKPHPCGRPRSHRHEDHRLSVARNIPAIRDF